VVTIYLLAGAGTLPGLIAQAGFTEQFLMGRWPTRKA
jgi:hypothetical protein